MFCAERMTGTLELFIKVKESKVTRDDARNKLEMGLINHVRHGMYAWDDNVGHKQPTFPRRPVSCLFVTFPLPGLEVVDSWG